MTQKVCTPRYGVTPLPKVDLLPCPRCGARAVLERGTQYYCWVLSVKCTNPDCRIRMLSAPYGDNGIVNPATVNYARETAAAAALAARWNSRPLFGVTERDGLPV